MKKLSRLKKSALRLTLGATLAVSATIMSPLSAQAEPVNSPAEIGAQMRQMLREAKNRIDELRGEATENIADIQKRLELMAEIAAYITENNLKEWTEETWNIIVQRCEQAGVAIDEVVPSISGCIHDEQGKPMYGVLVLVLAADIGIPTYALTGAGTVEQNPTNFSSWGSGFGLPILPVSNLFVPDSYENTFNQGGCYWVPLSPGPMKDLLSAWDEASIGSEWEEMNQATLTRGTVEVYPMLPGYNITPFATQVSFSDGVFSTRNKIGMSEPWHGYESGVSQ